MLTKHFANSCRIAIQLANASDSCTLLVGPQDDRLKMDSPSSETAKMKFKPQTNHPQTIQQRLHQKILREITVIPCERSLGEKTKQTKIQQPG